MMDVDLDLETDRIREFLKNKLEEIKSTNAELVTSLEMRRKTTLTHLEEIKKNCCTDDIKFGQIWKKVMNNKYILGLPVWNPNNLELDGINVILDWDSKSSLDYNFYLISSNNSNLLVDGLKTSDRLQKSGQIVIVLEVPFFADQLTHTITGIINFRQKHKKFTLRLPSVIQLSCQDVTDNLNVVQLCKVIDGNIDDFLACAFSNRKYQFVMVFLTDWNQLFDTTFEVNCFLSKVNVTSNNKFFLVHKLSSLLDGSLLEIEADKYINIYCKDQDVLIALIHYLHQIMVNVSIIPRNFYNPKLNSSELTEQVKKSLLEEITCLEGASNQNITKLRHDVIDLEHKTDLLMLRINEEAKPSSSDY